MDNHTDRFAVAKSALDLRTLCDAQLVRKGKSYVCPCCGSGTKANGTPAFSIKGERWKCFSCNNGGDVFDLVGILNDTTDRGEQLRMVQRMAGIPEGAGNPAPTGKGEALGWSDAITDATPAERPKKPVEEHAEGRKRHAAYIDACEAAMVEGCAGWTYLTGRGLTPDTIKRHRLGYDAQRRAVVMPYSGEAGEYYHIDRAIDLDTHTKGKYRKPKSDEVGAEPLFWPSDLTAPVLFVVEGTMDAYAVHQEGYPAVAVVSAKSYRPIVNRLTESHYDGAVCIMLDDDATGNEAADGLAAELDAAQILNVRVRQAPGCKDAGEALETKPEELAAVLADAAEKARLKPYEKLFKEERVRNPADIAADIDTLADFREPIPTGFADLDTALDGGLPRGVVVLGALSSLGKTTLIAQMADNMAEAGQPVLFVTIEQGAAEITAKSLARLMFEQHDGKASAEANADEVNRPSKRKLWSPKKRKVFSNALERYRKRIAPNLRIMDCKKRPSIHTIAKVARAMKQTHGKAPAVFIDYLQLLAPENEHDTDQTAIDKNMTALRQYADDLGTVFVVISSINRASYKDVLDMTCFKSSGSIEFSTDLALGMQVFNIKAKLSKVDEKKRAFLANEIYENTKQEEVRALELKVLKNRNGNMPTPVAITFHAKQCAFECGDVGAPMLWGDEEE